MEYLAFAIGCFALALALRPRAAGPTVRAIRRGCEIEYHSERQTFEVNREKWILSSRMTLVARLMDGDHRPMVFLSEEHRDIYIAEVYTPTILHMEKLALASA